MQKNKEAALVVLLIGIVVFFVSSNTYAACDPALGTKCGDFGSNTITFVSSTSDTCNLSTGTVACTRYDYTYTGNPTTIEVLIPKSVQTKFTATDAAAAGCNGGLVTDGTGDSANGFGRNIVTHNLCKVQPSNATFKIFADLSRPKAISWQEIVNKSITVDTLDGPAIPAAGVEETAVRLTTSEGVTADYTIDGNTITPGPGVKAIIPINKTKLCIPWSGIGTPTFTNASGSWTCETITFATEQCDIKTAGTDPCRFIGGACINY